MTRKKQKTRVLEDVKVDVKFKLAGLWVAAMFSWVYGDLLRLYSGDFKAGDDVLGQMISQEMLWLVSAITMIVAGAMVVPSLAFKAKANRWANIIVGVFYTGCNLIGFSSYPSACDKFLIVVSIVLTALVVWYA
jgi:hypothetical protein